MILFSLLVACVSGPTDEWEFPPGEAGPPGRPRWDTSIWTTDWTDAVLFDPTTSTIRFQLRTERWGYEPELYLLENRFTRDWDEQHTMEEVLRTPSPSRHSYFRRDLELVSTFWDFIPDITTILGPERYDPGGPDDSVLVAALVRDSAGRPADCIVFGYNPPGLAVPPLAVSYPRWLDPRYCRNVNP